MKDRNDWKTILLEYGFLQKPEKQLQKQIHKELKTLSRKKEFLKTVYAKKDKKIREQLSVAIIKQKTDFVAISFLTSKMQEVENHYFKELENLTKQEEELKLELEQKNSNTTKNPSVNNKWKFPW